MTDTVSSFVFLPVLIFPSLRVLCKAEDTKKSTASICCSAWYIYYCKMGYFFLSRYKEMAGDSGHRYRFLYRVWMLVQDCKFTWSNMLFLRANWILFPSLLIFLSTFVHILKSVNLILLGSSLANAQLVWIVRCISRPRSPSMNWACDEKGWWKVLLSNECKF